MLAIFSNCFCVFLGKQLQKSGTQKN